MMEKKDVGLEEEHQIHRISASQSLPFLGRTIKLKQSFHGAAQPLLPGPLRTIAPSVPEISLGSSLLPGAEPPTAFGLGCHGTQPASAPPHGDSPLEFGDSAWEFPEKFSGLPGARGSGWVKMVNGHGAWP